MTAAKFQGYVVKNYLIKEVIWGGCRISQIGGEIFWMKFYFLF